MNNADRTAAQERFVNDDAMVMVATNAFGMGIDKSNVRFVINWGLPLSLEEYYQEAGRAGRDGEPSECVLLWSTGDIKTAHYLIEHTAPDGTLSYQDQQAVLATRNRLLGAMIGYAMSSTCLRKRILSYFGQSTQELADGCNNCSVCAGDEAWTRVKRSVPSGFDAWKEGSSHGLVRRGSARRATPTRSYDYAASLEANSPDQELFERLRALRKDLANEQSIPPYMIFSDASLRAMVRIKPRGDEQFLSVPGVGRAKLERYGEAFLAEINR